MSIPISNKQEWRFLYHEEADRAGVRLNIEEGRGKTVLRAYEGKIQIDLIKYDRKSKQIIGEYQIFNSIYPKNTISGDIVFKIDLQDEKKWIGFPSEFNCVCAWIIWPLATQLEEIQSQSQKESLSLKSRIKKRFFGSSD